MYKYIFDPEYAGRIKALNNDEIEIKFIPPDMIHGLVLRGVTITIMALTLTYNFFLFFVAEKVIIGNTSSKEELLLQKRKFAYQMTNLCTNFVLGIIGCYYELVVQPQNPPVEKTINSFDEYALFCYLQVGYQLWSISVGLFFVNESFVMLFHHIAVLINSGASGFLRHGFRYWAPFFCGVVELSSVPLAMMNCFKDNPYWIKTNPIQYNLIRYIFAVSFLIIRVYMFLPRMTHMLYDMFILTSNSNIIPYIILMSLVWLGFLFLQILQIYWGSIIVTSLGKHIFGKSSTKAKKLV